jgi:hypothetical protein
MRRWLHCNPPCRHCRPTPLTKPLDTAYRRTDYRVRLPEGGYASVRVDARLPEALVRYVGKQCWAIITAWNPGSVRQSRETNRIAQRRLLALLRNAEPTWLRAAVGVGNEHWREPSLLVVGVDAFRLLAIAEALGQHAIICGNAGGKATLAWL